MSDWTPGTDGADDGDTDVIRNVGPARQKLGPCVACAAGAHHRCTGVACYRCPADNHRQTKTGRARA